MSGRTDDASIRVVLVDDDPLVRSGLALILGGAPDLDIVGQAGDGRAALSLVEDLRPDVVLMDIRMPVMDGIEATARLRSVAAPPRVVVLTTFGADDHVVRALSAGAAGFLLKDTPPADIVHAVRRVASGEPMLSPAVLTTLIAQVTQQAPDRSADARERLALLTDREREIADAVSRGLSNAQIAAELYLSVPTVKAHVGHVFAKLGVDNRVQVALCVRDARDA
ncbi:response regulator [Luteimicrobium subarcticum]|uniref:LuxR family two component transcriptional regulator n=1 Tax=Luteimicrobium subarcticum TaxID=620910 RepID=A0A2M8W705_9MICO|nr:response regulator transcription factor [Luteimicrobium subarcticum]PJI86717.1 LuxR family two component transcriptional regulator [Luteimicrobium subarcticum]